MLQMQHDLQQNQMMMMIGGPSWVSGEIFPWILTSLTSDLNVKIVMIATIINVF